MLDFSGKVIHRVKFGYGLERSASLREKIERMINIAKGIVLVVDEYTLLNEADSLTKLIKPLVCIEGYSYNSRFDKRGNAAIDLGELGGVVKSQLWLRFGIEPTLVPPATGRKAIFGNGRTPKAQVIPLLRDQGFHFKDHNIADAYVVAETLRRRSVA